MYITWYYIQLLRPKVHELCRALIEVSRLQLYLFFSLSQYGESSFSGFFPLRNSNFTFPRRRILSLHICRTHPDFIYNRSNTSKTSTNEYVLQTPNFTLHIHAHAHTLTTETYYNLWEEEREARPTTITTRTSKYRNSEQMQTQSMVNNHNQMKLQSPSIPMIVANCLRIYPSEIALLVPLIPLEPPEQLEPQPRTMTKMRTRLRN